MDADGDGSITKEEFINACNKNPKLADKVTALLMKKQGRDIWKLN